MARMQRLPRRIEFTITSKKNSGDTNACKAKKGKYHGSKNGEVAKQVKPVGKLVGMLCKGSSEEATMWTKHAKSSRRMMEYFDKGVIPREPRKNKADKTDKVLNNHASSKNRADS